MPTPRDSPLDENPFLDPSPFPIKGVEVIISFYLISF
jgi:hypothetical protein